MNIVRKHNIPASVQLSLKLLEAQPAQARIVVLVVLGIDAGPDNMVPQVRHGSERDIIEHQERHAHVGREHTDDAHERFFKFGHLRLDGFVVQCKQVGVAPSMTMSDSPSHEGRLMHRCINGVLKDVRVRRKLMTLSQSTPGQVGEILDAAAQILLVHTIEEEGRDRAV